MLARLKEMRSPAALAGIAESLGDTVVLDESLSMGDAVAMAWDLRSAPPSTIRRIIVPTEPAVTPGWVVRASSDRSVPRTPRGLSASGVRRNPHDDLDRGLGRCTVRIGGPGSDERLRRIVERDERRRDELAGTEIAAQR